MSVEVLMPLITKLGDEGVVTAWLVEEGGTVTAGQLIAEVQAEKVAEDVHAPSDGIADGLVAINAPVAQGAAICRLVDASEAATPLVAEPAADGAAPATEVPRVVASPSAKRVARDLGLDLATVTGTGPAGRITEADVRAAAPPTEPAGVAMNGLRAVIARNMRRSVRETAAVTLTTTVDATASAGAPVTAWVVHAVAVALLDHPQLNGTREDDRFVPAATTHIAVAIQTDDGLIAPVVRDPADATVDEVATKIRRLAERHRAGELGMSDYEGATFTVTNLGGYGIDGFTPIINLPQVAILGVGALRTIPGFDDAGHVVARKTMTLSLTFDHAFVDGAPAAELLSRVRELLEAGAA